MRGEDAGSRRRVLRVAGPDLRRSQFDCIAVKNPPEIYRAQPIAAPTKALLEQKFHLLVGGGGGVMTTLQAICLGAMLAWTPTLVVLALLLHAFPLDDP
jgi:hypothetical protein